MIKPRSKFRKHPARKPGAGVHKPAKGPGSYKRQKRVTSAATWA